MNHYANNNDQVNDFAPGHCWSYRWQASTTSVTLPWPNIIWLWYFVSEPFAVFCMSIVTAVSDPNATLATTETLNFPDASDSMTLATENALSKPDLMQCETVDAGFVLVKVFASTRFRSSSWFAQAVKQKMITVAKNAFIVFPCVCRNFQNHSSLRSEVKQRVNYFVAYVKNKRPLSRFFIGVHV